MTRELCTCGAERDMKFNGGDPWCNHCKRYIDEPTRVVLPASQGEDGRLTVEDILPEPVYPEHEKLQKIKDRSQAIGEFIDWLNQEKGLRICELLPHYEGTWTPVHTSIQDLLAERFGIDQAKLEEEKRAMLDECRALHDEREAEARDS